MAAAIEEETPGAQGGALPFDIHQWLTDNGLGQYSKVLTEQNVAIEELLCLNEEDLRDEATHFGISRPIHKNRFVKAVQKLVESSQKIHPINDKQKKNDSIYKKEAITITKEESQALDKIKSQIKKMTDVQLQSDHIGQNLTIMSSKCENDIKHLFDGLMNSLKSRQTELIAKTQHVRNTQLLMITQNQSNINKYVDALKQFETNWSNLMLNKNNEPGQGIKERTQKIVSKTNELLQREATLDLNLQHKIHIAFLLDAKLRESINASISKIGAIHANDVPNAPIIRILHKHIRDVSMQVVLNFSNNDQHSLPDTYCIQIAETEAMMKGKDNDEEKKGEIGDEMETDMKLEWRQIISNGRIYADVIENTTVNLKDLKCNTMYMLRCKCNNKYGCSAFSPYVSFRTKPKIFKMDSGILTENEIQIFCQKLLIQQLGKEKEKLGVELLFRASRDGFNAMDFHSKCDGKRKTIVIIESNLGNVFGGYTKIAWTQDNKWHHDGTCVLFLCRNLNRNNKQKDFEMYPIKQSHQSKAVKHYASHGPCFGKGHDLLIVNASNITDSRSDGESFVNLKGDQLTGSLTQIHNKYWHFVVRDYEVFQIV